MIAFSTSWTLHKSRRFCVPVKSLDVILCDVPVASMELQSLVGNIDGGVSGIPFSHGNQRGIQFAVV